MIIIKNIQEISYIILFNIIEFFVVLFKLMTFTIKSEYSKWLDTVSGLLVWMNVTIIIYFIYIILK